MQGLMLLVILECLMFASKSNAVNITETNLISSRNFVCNDPMTKCHVVCAGGNVVYLASEMSYFEFYCNNVELHLKDCTFSNGIMTAQLFGAIGTKVTNLTIEDCNLKTIEVGAFRHFAVKQMKSLNLQRVTLKSLHAQTFAELKALTHFKLLNQKEDEKLPFVGATFLQSMAGTLEELVMEQSSSGEVYDPAHWLTGAKFTKLKRVLLQRNNFGAVLNAQTFANLVHTNELTLGFCGITALEMNTFDAIAETLEYLDLSYNHLTILEGIFPVSWLPRSVHVELVGNDWHCGCDNEELIEYLKQTTIIFQGEEIICVTPAEWYGLHIRELESCYEEISTATSEGLELTSTQEEMSTAEVEVTLTETDTKLPEPETAPTATTTNARKTTADVTERTTNDEEIKSTLYTDMEQSSTAEITDNEREETHSTDNSWDTSITEKTTIMPYTSTTLPITLPTTTLPPISLPTTTTLPTTSLPTTSHPPTALSTTSHPPTILSTTTLPSTSLSTTTTHPPSTRSTTTSRPPTSRPPTSLPPELPGYIVCRTGPSSNITRRPTVADYLLLDVAVCSTDSVRLTLKPTKKYLKCVYFTTKTDAQTKYFESVTVNMLIENLSSAQSYVFCLVGISDEYTSPFNCRAQFLWGPAVSDDVWLRTVDIPLVVSLSIVGVVICFVLGGLIIYCILRYRRQHFQVRENSVS